MKNRTAFLVADKTFEIKDTEMPVVGGDDLLVEVKHVGVCGSDLAFFQDVTLHGTHRASYPVVLGHESAGVVVGMGENVKGFAVGDKVSVEPGVPCMKCDYCMQGLYNLCDDMDFMACYPWHRGALQKYIAHPAMMCFKMPDNVSTLEGALIEPLAVGMYAATKGEAVPGKTALILGSGCIGLMTLMACKARGASTIYVADLFDNRLAKAKELGATEVINSGQVDLVERIMALTDGRGADLVFETAGNVKTAELTQKLVKKGGRIVMVGNIHGTTGLDFVPLSEREIEIVTIFRYRNLYPMLVETVAAGGINVKQICTDVYAFEDVQRGFEDATERKMDVLKAVIEL